MYKCHGWINVICFNYSYFWIDAQLCVFYSHINTPNSPLNKRRLRGRTWPIANGLLGSEGLATVQRTPDDQSCTRPLYESVEWEKTIDLVFFFFRWKKWNEPRNEKIKSEIYFTTTWLPIDKYYLTRIVFNSFFEFRREEKRSRFHRRTRVNSVG